MPEQGFLLGLVHDPGHKRGDSVQAFVVVLPCPGTVEALGDILGIVLHISEIPGLRVPGISLDGLAHDGYVLVVLLDIGLDIQVRGQQAQYLGAAYIVGCGYHGGGASPALRLGAQGPLGGIVIPSTAIVEYVPGGQKPAFLTEVRAGHIVVEALQARIDFLELGFVGSAGLPHVADCKYLGGERRPVMHEGRFFRGRSGVLADDFVAAAGIYLAHCPAYETAVPGIEAVPILAGAEMANGLAEGIYGIYHVGQQRGLEELQPEGQTLRFGRTPEVPDRILYR